MWISIVWQQMEATCSQVIYLRLITQPISGRTGIPVLHPGTARLVAASSLTRLEAAPYSLAMTRGCSFPPIAARLGSQSMKDFRNARFLMLKLRARILFICLPALLVKASGENSLVQVPRDDLGRELVVVFKSHAHTQSNCDGKPIADTKPNSNRKSVFDSNSNSDPAAYTDTTGQPNAQNSPNSGASAVSGVSPVVHSL